jgi:hypothetical protein
VPTVRSSFSSVVGPGGRGVPGAGLKSLVGSSGEREQPAVSGPRVSRRPQARESFGDRVRMAAGT